MGIKLNLKRHTALVGAGVVAASLLSIAGTAHADEADIAQLRDLILQQQAQIEALSSKLETLAVEAEASSEAAKRANEVAWDAAATADEAARVARETDEQMTQVTTAQTPPKMVKSGNENVALSISGQVNRALLFADDGKKEDIYNVDNDNSSTRVRFKGKAKLNENWTAGTTIEVQIESNSSGAVNQFADNGVGAGGFTERKLEVWFDGPWGKVSLGQGDTASNGTSESDLSGTKVVTSSDIKDMAGGLAFVNSATGLFCTDVNGDGLCTGADALNTTVRGAFSNLDGLSRDDRIRYDTPKFGGFQLSTSAVAGGEADVALRYSAKMGDFKVKAAAAYVDPSSTSGGTDSRVNGSISVAHKNGGSLTVAAADTEGKGAAREASYYYVKAGWTFKDLLPMGKTSFSVDYTEMEDRAALGDEATSYSFAGVHNIKDYGTELYMAYRRYELDRVGVTFDDIDAVMTGARIKF